MHESCRETLKHFSVGKEIIGSRIGDKAVTKINFKIYRLTDVKEKIKEIIREMIGDMDFSSGRVVIDFDKEYENVLVHIEETEPSKDPASSN